MAVSASPPITRVMTIFDANAGLENNYPTPPRQRESKLFMYLCKTNLDKYLVVSVNYPIDLHNWLCSGALSDCGFPLNKGIAPLSPYIVQ